MVVPAVAQESPIQKYVPLRLYGTNLYDFTPVIAFPSRGVPTPGAEKYFLSGRVGSEKDGGVEIITAVITRYQPIEKGPISPTNSFTIASIKQAPTQNTGIISAAEYLALSPAAQTNYRAIKITEGTILMNCPPELLRDGRFDGFALPFYSSKDPKVLRYDFGLPFTGNKADYKAIFKVTPSGIKRVPNFKPQELKQETDAEIRRIVEFQRKRAGEGSAVAQFDLGMRYITGDGVEPDETKGIGLVKEAANAGNKRAQSFLESPLGKGLSKEFHPQP